MIVITDLQGGGWDDWKFKNKKDLKDFLQAESCNNQGGIGGYSEEEYYKINADVSLDEYCEMFQIEYEENKNGI